jgi:tetratricopeptide (TPR) repeat protein
MKLGRALIGSFAIALCASNIAAAQELSPRDEQARAHFEAGVSYLDDGDYDLAVREFTRAYELSHRAGLLYNLYVAHERSSHLAEAIDYLSRY